MATVKNKEDLAKIAGNEMAAASSTKAKPATRTSKKAEATKVQLPLEKDIDAVRADIVNYDASLVKAKQKSRDDLYKLLQTAYNVVVQLAQEDNEDVLTELMLERNITLKNDSNPLTPMVQILWGHWDTVNSGIKKGDKVWKANSSAAKYANVFRFLMEDGTPTSSVAKRMGGFKHEVHGNRMDGIINNDRVNHPDKKTAAKRKRKLDYLADRPSGAVFTMGPGHASAAKDGWIVMIGRVEGSKMNVIRPAKFKNDEAMKSFVVGQVEEKELGGSSQGNKVHSSLAKLKAS